MPLYVTVLLTIAVCLVVMIAYAAVIRTKNEQRRRARWLAGEDR